MKKISLDCFVADNFCQITSSDQSITIDNPLEKEVSLEVFNHGASNCVVKMKTVNFSTNNDLNLTKLILSDSKQIFFKDNLQIFKETEIVLGSIMANSSANYLFSIDLLDLVLEGKKLVFDFDLILDFDCEDLLEKNGQTQQKINSDVQFKETAVLSANDVLQAKDTDREKVNPIFLLLSILFVAIFFVIMKFIHEQKKKKR